MTLPNTTLGGSRSAHTLILGGGNFSSPSSAQGRGTSNHALMIAALLDAATTNVTSSSEAPLSQALSSSRGQSLAQVWRRMSSPTRSQIESHWGATQVATLVQLADETDPELFASDLYSFAQNLEQQNQPERALAIYGFISSEAGQSFPQVVRERSQHRLEIIAQGGGSFGEQLEFQMGNFMEGATDPTMVIGMAVGSTVFTGARSLILPRMMRSTGLLGRVPFATRLAASSLATVPEVGAFWATSKGLRELMHPGTTQWDLATTGRELTGLAMTLGLLKGSGFVFGRTAQALRSSRPQIWQHAGMLAGIGGGHGAESLLGWREWHGWMPFLTDVGVTGLQFHVGGQLSHTMFPRLYQHNQGLSRQMSQMEARQVQDLALGRRFGQMEAGMRRLLFGDMGGPWQPGLATSLAGGRDISTSEIENFLQGQGPHARDYILMMSSQDGKGDSGAPGVGRPSRSITLPSGKNPITEPLGIELPPAVEGHLPVRTGGTKDPFESTGSPSAFPHDMLVRLPVPVREKLLRKLGWANKDIERVGGSRLDSKTKEALDAIDAEDFGFSVGNILRNGMTWFLSGEIQSHTKETLSSFPEARQQEIRTLDELVGLTEFAHRTQGNSSRELEAVRRSIETGLGPEGQSSYESLKQGLVNLLSPRVGRDVIEPHEGAVSIGNGDMMSLLNLLRHRIMPGELNWRYQLYAIARNQKQADEVNLTGINLEHGRKPLGPDKRINFRHDPKIRVVGPEGLDGISREDVLRSMRFQMLNVTSTGLPHILTESYLENLPPNALLLEVIKGFIGPNRGRFKPESHEQQSLLSFELINQALDQARRSDVEVVSGGGFIPGKDLWWGNRVRMAFAGRESFEGSRHSPAAEEVARLLAGRGMNNEFIVAAYNHWQKSTEIGGAMKNVVSLLAGIRTVRLARRLIEEGRNPTDEEAQTLVREEVIDSLEGLLKEALKNEGIPSERLGFVDEVKEDFRLCCFINLRSVMQLVRRAMNSEVPVTDIQALTQWVQENFVESDTDSRRYQYSDTRNPLVGIIAGLVEIWRSGNPQLSPREIDVPMTQEGVDSLGPLVLRNTHPSHPVEFRAMHEDIYELHDLFNPEKATQPLRITPEVIDALRGRVEGLSPTSLRSVLEGRPQQAIKFLTEEIQRLRRREATAMDDNIPRARNRLERQRQAMPRLIEAIGLGTPYRLLDFPFYIPPYENMFLIPLELPKGQGPGSYSYIRIKGTEVNDRTTQLGLHLNSLGVKARGQVDIDLTGLDRRVPKQAMTLVDIENAVEEILLAHARSQEDFQIKLSINGREISISQKPRPPYDRVTYESELEPLVQWINDSPSNGHNVTARDIRGARMGVRDLMTRFLRTQRGWPMLLGYYGGPIQQALKAAFPRPENRTLFGIYSAGRLRDAFTIYRGEMEGSSVPMVLNQHLLTEFSQHIPEALAQALGRPLSSSDYFNGLPLTQFRELYTRYAEQQGIANPEVNLISLKGMPIERALAGRISDINPAVLRVFLQIESSERDQMLVELEKYYERSDESGMAEVREILQRYLNPFERNHRTLFEDDRIQPLYQAFQDYGHNAIWRLIGRRADQGPVSSVPPRIDGSGPDSQ